MQLPPGAAYTAMGSSFAAGPGLRPRATTSPRRAGRSSSNYPHLLARHFGLDLDDVTFSGATTADLLTSPKPGTPPQLHAVHERTRLITITTGGNDVAFVPTITLASLPRPPQGLPAVRRRIEHALDADATSVRFDRLRRSLATVISTAQHRAPDAKLFLVGYLSIVPPDDAELPPQLSHHVADWARGTASRLRTVWEEAAHRENVEYVDVAQLSAAHHAGSDQQWVREFHYSLRGGAPYHPTLDGMREVADAVARSIQRN